MFLTLILIKNHNTQRAFARSRSPFTPCIYFRAFPKCFTSRRRDGSIPSGLWYLIERLSFISLCLLLQTVHSLGRCFCASIIYYFLYWKASRAKGVIWVNIAQLLLCIFYAEMSYRHGTKCIVHFDPMNNGEVSGDSATLRIQQGFISL